MTGLPATPSGERSSTGGVRLLMSEELLGYLILAAIMALAVAVVWLVGKPRK